MTPTDKCIRKRCDKKVAATGLCASHYQKKRRKDPKNRIYDKQWEVIYAKRPKRRFSRAKGAAKTYGKEWKISFALFERLLQNSCHYCGSYIDECGSGIDRVDSTIGYVPNNVVSCCGLCNRMKSNMPMDLFRLKIIQIAKKMQSK